jgi:hypothetical protein
MPRTGLEFGELLHFCGRHTEADLDDGFQSDDESRRCGVVGLPDR